ncbi:hypothetical protein CDL12_07821 [Handroanthus impetiginosus]|uniref:Uncharacterized protein n=1 Tax=Handroanthus impetiginosus TaxID=429701 RepID=A0A2G9HQC2_9LAMI|nr:hypothetical protein CDL12_07821 [Handroanthus impetiginosus]
MTSSGGFPAVDAEKELNPGLDKDFKVDPMALNATSSKEIKEKYEAAERKEQEKKDAMQSFKTTIIVSGIIVAVAGAIFAITKKLREK